ncbi:MAG: hypothetical protein QXY01_07325, partial [Candidatus Bathyarchaeia archaeon]
MNSSVIGLGILVLAALLTLPMMFTRRRMPKTSRSILAALMLSVMILSAASTSPTLVKALDEITTIATITDQTTETLVSEFTDTKYYETEETYSEGQQIPGEIIVEIDGTTVTFTDLRMVKEVIGPYYPLVDDQGNIIYFYQRPPSDKEAADEGWVIRIPYGDGYIEVTAHEINQGDQVTLDLDDDGAKYYSYEGGTWVERTWDGGEPGISLSGDFRLFFSVAKSGGSGGENIEITGADGNKLSVDGNDIISAQFDPSLNGFVFGSEPFFDLDRITGESGGGSGGGSQGQGGGSGGGSQGQGGGSGGGS